jgi:pimeloyl-ACP methyl ester carboxylesterase
MSPFHTTPEHRGEFVPRSTTRVQILRPAIVTAVLAVVGTASAATLLLQDGRTLKGDFAQIGGVAEDPLNPKPSAGEVAVTPILVVDDGLRRTYIHYSQVRRVLETTDKRDVKIRIWQDVAERGSALGRLGGAVRVTPFDEYGRRIYEMHSTEGLLSVVQGITEITPVYARVESVMGGPRPVVWDMRIATSSVPADTLHRILTTAVKQDDVEARLQVVRFYIEGGRYRDAGQELERIVHDFPERKDLGEEVSQLRRLAAQLVLGEIQLRAEAGQHGLARALLAKFPSEGISGETLQQVRELLAKYEAEDRRREGVLAALEAQIALLGGDNERRLAEGFAKEIAAEADSEAIGRLASFERLVDDAQMSAERKVALAISGWLVGANQATDDFQLAVSLAGVRDKVRQYLREPAAADRSKIAAELLDTEGATIERVAQILKLMKPPLDVPPTVSLPLPPGEGRGEGALAEDNTPSPYPLPPGEGLETHGLTVPGLPGEEDVRYVVQLPPEYNPLRRYGTIVSLPGADASPEQMIDFWAGPVSQDGPRLGQATRRGYITIAVDWREPHQTAYGYSAREHHAVLGALRDACRRFAVDTDRVFLTGHGAGGDAAWDLGLAHPDVWAGVLPIVALADRYSTRYSPNAEYVPWYFVAGELDGDKMSHNATQWDRYLKPKFDTTVVEYLGRGFEPFGDELQRMFDWMALRRRHVPTEFECATMRPWDNFFWWVEVRGLAEKSMVAPTNWPPPRGARPFRVDSKRLAGNKIAVTTGAEQVTVWLSPDSVKFDEPLEIKLLGRSIGPRNRMVKPEVDVLLEDARTRADRQHPFWAKVESQ